MTREELERALLQMGETMRTLVRAFAPDANQCDISMVGNHIMVDACHYDSKSGERSETYLDATLFSDGVIRHGERYSYPEEVTA